MADKIFGEGLSPIPLTLVTTPVVPAFGAEAQGVYIAGLGNVSATKGAAVSNLAAITTVAAAGTAPTKAEFDVVVTDLAAARTTINALLASLRAANLIA